MPKAEVKSKAKRGEICVVRKGGRVALPLGIRGFRLGQRVYFHSDCRGLLMLEKPKRCFKGRLLSTRICRSVRSLAMYGP